MAKDPLAPPAHASRVLAADWVLPVSSPAIRNGAVAFADGVIEWVGPLARLPVDFAERPVERFDGILAPGLVNGHTHLQYTGFAELGRGTFRDFEHWSEAFEMRYEAVEDPAEWGRAAREGASLALATGTTAAAEIVTDVEARGVLAESGLGGIEYLEAIGETEGRWAAGGRAAYLEKLDALLPDAHDGVTIGVSPHAPYSLDASVIRELVAMARERGMRLHTHVGESSVEAALYASGAHDVLEIYGDLRDEFALVRQGGAGLTTGRYAERVGILGPDSHFAHGVYLDRADRELLLGTGTRLALCPRSNRVIGLDAPPVADYLSEGHEIAIGTDSLSSSPSLDLLGDVAELARIARAQGYAGGDLHQRLIRAATLGGAAVLGREDIGALRPGMRADLAVFDVVARTTAHWAEYETAGEAETPERALVERGEGSCVLTVIGGETRYRR